MTDIIFNFVKYSESSIIASNRIAGYIASRLDLPIVDNKITIEKYNGVRLNKLFIVNGAYAFCSCLPELAGLINRADKIIWAQNDYTIKPPTSDSEATSPFRKSFRENYAKVSFFTTCEDHAAKTPFSSYVNWNQLTFDAEYDSKKIQIRRLKATDDLFYYGSYRQNRLKYFERYLMNPAVRTTISCPNNSFEKKFNNVTNIGPMREDFFKCVGSHGMGLYIEDRQSHSQFHSPANRFYEMLSAGLPMVFQQECGTMMRKAGFNPSAYSVTSTRDICRLFKERECIGEEQRKAWVRDFRKELDSQFDNAMEKLG